MNIEQKILDRLTALIEMGERVLATQHSPGEMIIGDDRVDTQLAHQWATSAQNLLLRVFGRDSEHYRHFEAQTKAHLTYSPVYHAQGILKAAKDDYEHGHLFELRRLIEAEVFDDFLEQAEHLLESGYYQAAAVLTGGVLEDSLRKICLAKGIALATKPKLDAMNSDLAKAGVFSVLVQKRITALADLRNKAAHAKWNEFTRDDVREMVEATRRLMEQHFA
jgi:HEPN domain-containing protein